MPRRANHRLVPAHRFSRCLHALSRRFAPALAGVLLAGAAHAAPDTSPVKAQAKLNVVVVVAPHASVRVAPPAALTVTPEDAARGYVEVQAPLQLEVYSNLPQGYTLMFQRRGEHVRQARVQAPDGEFLVGEAGALRSRPPGGRGLWRDLLQLRVRFELAPGTAPGQYPWPLAISMMST